MAPPGVGKWDRFTSWGVKIKGGEESVFNAETLGQMVDNFSRRNNDLSMCYDHQSAFVSENGQPAPALAFYNALALVIDGAVVKFAAHDPAVSPPDASGLDNGVYGYRSEVTELGRKLLPSYKYISPMFTDAGADEQGNPIGYDLMDVAATNTPFQDGVGLTFHRGYAVERPQKKETPGMDPELMKKLGLAEGASGDEMRGAMTAYVASCEEKLSKYAAAEEDAKKMAEAPAEEEKKDEAEKMADEPAEDDKKKMADDKDEDDMKAMSRALGIGDASPRAIRYAVEATLISVRNAVADRAELEKLRSEALATREQGLQLAAEQFATDAVTSGQWPEEKKANLASLFRKSADDAKAVLFKKGEFTHVRKNFSNQLERSADRTEATEKKAGPNTMGANFGAKAKAFAKENNTDLRSAQLAVAKQFPDLYNAYKAGE